MKAFDIQRMLLDKFPVEFLAEVAVRSLFTFLLVFIFLKVSGRRGVRQMSLFEVLIILTLGSAAGDVTFYDDVPLLPVFAVFISIMIFYRLATWLMSSHRMFQNWLEGKPVVIVRNGQFEWQTMKKRNITHDEFFMEFRLAGVEHLGQVRLAILEVNGAISVFFFEPEEVKPGLPVMPADYVTFLTKVPKDDEYACHHCSLIHALKKGETHRCPQCGSDKWVTALTRRRIM
ncbi:DUF421 domain-containing protein [Chimaeribacter coloradensis]|uniref:DUF421 domain-containing protein n=1 Tax=Chimaeribacter coloradensis TaxID=2060068 RepID=A0A2N5ECK6_9GAMM|nr:DUF421 domain-containing protein [Chimaeribacter coloradensis]PLR40274.1 DUF421 domain-containing protein [Chimaeribacter coloradensis]